MTLPSQTADGSASRLSSAPGMELFRNWHVLFPLSVPNCPSRSRSNAPMKDDLLPRAGTSIPGLDNVLEGGFARNRLHLLEGSPGTGKTTIALQFLMAGAAAGERGIYVTLAETEEELRGGARSHGWELAKE